MSGSNHHARPSVRQDLTGSITPGRSSSRQDAATAVAGSGGLLLLALGVVAYAAWRRLR